MIKSAFAIAKAFQTCFHQRLTQLFWESTFWKITKCLVYFFGFKKRFLRLKVQTNGHSIHFGDALGREVCVERRIASLTIMSHFQHNVCKFLIKLHFYYIIKVLYFLFIYFISNISDGFTYICFMFRLFKTYREWTVYKEY